MRVFGFEGEYCIEGCEGMFGSEYHTGPRGIFGGRTELTEVPGSGIEVLPILPKCRVPVSSFPNCSVGY